jgi:hypothetical protein
MKAWRLLRGNTTLQILHVDEKTRHVSRITNLPLKSPMTEGEAQNFMDSQYPNLTEKKE